MTFGSFERRLVAVATVAFAGIGIAVLAGGAPVAWLLLGLCGVVSASVLVVQLYRGRLFEPLTVIAAVALVSFVARPLQLFLSADDLKSYYFQGSDAEQPAQDREPGDRAVRDARPEGTARAGTDARHGRGHDLRVPRGGGLPVAVGTELGGSPRPRRRGVSSRIDVQPTVIACLLIAVIGQVAVLVKVGGPVGAANHMLDQEVLERASPTRCCSGSAPSPCSCGPPGTPRAPRRPEWAFGLVLFEVCGFYALAGTRTRVFLTLLMMAVIAHYLVASLAEARATGRRPRGGRVRERACSASARPPRTSRSARRSARRPRTSSIRAAS